jgi:hypothetical protein
MRNVGLRIAKMESSKNGLAISEIRLSSLPIIIYQVQQQIIISKKVRNFEELLRCASEVKSTPKS